MPCSDDLYVDLELIIAVMTLTDLTYYILKHDSKCMQQFQELQMEQTCFNIRKRDVDKRLRDCTNNIHESQFHCTPGTTTNTRLFPDFLTLVHAGD